VGHLVLAVHTPVDRAGLDERDDLLLNFLDRPAERAAHAIELDRREGLEVEHDRPVADHVRQLGDVLREVEIQRVAGLQPISVISIKDEIGTGCTE
jgi:hypothetical protein